MVGTRDARALEQERRRLRLDTRYDLNWLIGRRDELIRIRATEKKSAAQLAKEIKPAPLSYPRLPREIVPPGRVRSVPLDKEYLVNLSKTDIERFRSMMRIYGPQITDRLNGLG